MLFWWKKMESIQIIPDANPNLTFCKIWHKESSTCNAGCKKQTTAHRHTGVKSAVSRWTKESLVYVVMCKTRTEETLSRRIGLEHIVSVWLSRWQWGERAPLLIWLYTCWITVTNATQGHNTGASSAEAIQQMWACFYAMLQFKVNILRGCTNFFLTAVGPTTNA